MKPTMLILSFSEIANDARVLKQVQAFSQHYEVTTCGFGTQPLEGVEHLRADAYDAPSYPERVRNALALVDRAVSRMHGHAWTYWRIPYVQQARRMLRRRRFDVVLANDVDTVALALRAAPPSRVHADLHEFFPGLHDDSTELGRRQTAYLTWLVKRYASRAASSTTVGRGIAEAYRRYGLACGVVTNATPRMALAPSAAHTPLRLVHSGNAQPSRQLELTMRAVAESSADLTLDLFLMPNDVVYLERLKQLADELGNRVTVRDPLPQSQLVAALNAYDVGVHVLPPTSFNNAHALPNKFFDYVQARLGLLIGPSPEMARVLEEHGFGAVSTDFTVDAIRAELDRFTPAVVSEWKQRADAAADILSADRQVDVWVQAIARIAP